MLPIGTVCAFAGQANPVSGGANNIWQSISCASINSKDGILNPDIPLTFVEAEGWMFCDGRYLSKNAYPELFAVLGYLYGKKEDTFAIPDYRGLFLRGVDAGSGMDPDADKRVGPQGTGTSSGIGSLQCDAIQDHVHTYEAINVAAVSQQGSAAGQSFGDLNTSSPNSPARVSSETRCKNIAVNYIIRYR
jgi:microcystin-dependent protein